MTCRESALSFVSINYHAIFDDQDASMEEVVKMCNTGYKLKWGSINAVQNSTLRE